MELIITSHAQQRMDRHGITPEQIRLTLQRGAKFQQTDGLVAIYTYVRVAYKIVGDKYIIKTVMIER